MESQGPLLLGCRHRPRCKHAVAVRMMENATPRAVFTTCKRVTGSLMTTNVTSEIETAIHLEVGA